MQWKRLPQWYLLLSYALPNAVPGQEGSCFSYFVGGRDKGEKNVIPDTVMLGTDVSLEMTS
jgi:hypothetical protein